MRKGLRVTAGVVAVLLLLGAGLLVWGLHALRKNSEGLRAAFQEELHRIRPAFLEDQQLARRFPALAATGRERDAGPFLNPRIRWDGDPGRIARWRAALPNPPPPLGLEAPLVEQVPEEWWNADRAVWGGLDFSWMTAIRSFDHWDVERHSPWRDVGTPFWPNGFPLFFDLTPWAKLRLAKGLAQGHPAEAVAEVEHLASLLLSTETVLGASIGLQYLGFVDQALGALEADGKRPPASANRIDGPTRARLWRAIMAAQDFLRPQTPPDLREVEPAIVAGRCAALNEALHAALATLALDRPEDASGARWLEALLQAETVCRMTWVREAWRDPAHRDPRLFESVCDSEGIGAWACRTVKAFPFTRAMERRLAAEVLLQIALANYLKHPAYP